ncbi:MarR family winged helix-turn-helix transcriptional regulator [Sphingomonas sp. AOB5]|uniref:MarR family winged helix-turn-helix transcriptional regulator n=1 Tax=Sphingomonas sp. AOB5 TaxID=3034017 RepID=UPI0023F87C76|nr:MarR family winged helix-turn-helix transcriptional regulator [Sphingomonas sp. AOB5]MDF7775622.1 MarR family winged helix-turn-helix transcriptional regulator [Sphingomonas sp. AOB5]
MHELFRLDGSGDQALESGPGASMTTAGAKPGKNQPSDADPMPLDVSMGYLIRRTFRALTDVLEDKLAEHKLSSSMWYFLRLLWEQDGKTQKELSHELGLTQPTTVAAMDNLERRGLIQRKRNVEDRRKINIYLTPAGKALKEEIQPFALQVNEIALRDLTRAEVETLRKLLQSINISVQRYWTDKP